MKTSSALNFRYAYEEFSDHVKAMRTVHEWEYTSRFGHLGHAQTSRANSARVIEYFSDSYEDPKEAVHKAELFLSIYDYLGRNAAVFGRKGLMDEQNASVLVVDPALLRAVHYTFTVSAQAASTAPKKVLTLAKAFQEIEPSI